MEIRYKRLIIVIIAIFLIHTMFYLNILNFFVKRRYRNRPNHIIKNEPMQVHLIILFILFVCTYLIVPFIFMHSIVLQRLAMFTNIGLETDPQAFEPPILGIKNFYLSFFDANEPNNKVTLGVWHVLPTKLAQNVTDNTKYDFDKALATSGYPVIIYFHGSGEVRLDLFNKYLVLRDFFHVIAFDYRGFGDSDNALLSELGIVNDSIQLYEWVRNKTASDIYVYGHSLGTALSTHTVAKLKDYGTVPTGLVLEAPFTTMREEIPVHEYGKYLAWLPWLNMTILDPLYRNGFRFETSKHVLNVGCPIMILHAEDDSVVPYTLGKKLAEIAQNDRNPMLGNVTFHLFGAEFEYDHYWLYTSPVYPIYIDEFIKVCDSYKVQNKILSWHRNILTQI